jgi:hypothetical protein
MKKTLSVSAILPEKRSLFLQLQHHCFGFALYTLFRDQFPDHPDIPRFQDPVLSAAQFQLTYEQNHQNLTITNPWQGIRETQGKVHTITIEHTLGKWSFKDLPHHIFCANPVYILHFASVSASEGHAIAVLENSIGDTRTPILIEPVPAQNRKIKILEKMAALFSAQNPGKSKGEMVIQVVTYHKILERKRLYGSDASERRSRSKNLEQNQSTLPR